MGIAEPLAVGFVARQAATALAYTRQQLGKTDRSALFAHLKPGFRVLEIGPGEGACHRHWPPGLHYTAVDAPLTPSARRASAPPPEPPELPVQATCESFRLLRGAWQELLPELASGKGRGSFDSVVVVMPSTIYFGPNQGLLGGAPRRSKGAPALSRDHSAPARQQPRPTVTPPARSARGPTARPRARGAAQAAQAKPWPTLWIPRHVPLRYFARRRSLDCSPPGVLRTGFRVPRPRAEWEALVRTARALLAPRRGQSCSPVPPLGSWPGLRPGAQPQAAGRLPSRSRTAGPPLPGWSVRRLGPRGARPSSLAEVPPKGPIPLPFDRRQAPGGTLLTTDVSSAHSLVAAALLPFSQRRPPLGEVRRRSAYHLHARTHARRHAGTQARVHLAATHGQAVL